MFKTSELILKRPIVEQQARPRVLRVLAVALLVSVILYSTFEKKPSIGRGEFQKRIRSAGMMFVVTLPSRMPLNISR
jgi:hypothetical protein